MYTIVFCSFCFFKHELSANSFENHLPGNIRVHHQTLLVNLNVCSIILTL